MIDERRPHFYLNNTKKSYPYQAPSGGGRDVLPPDRDLHAHKLFTIYSQVIKNIQQQRAINAAIRERGGSYLEFTANKDLFIPSKFEDNTQGIKLLNVKTSLQIGSGTSWGHLIEKDCLIQIISELIKPSSGTKTLTMGTANKAKIADTYVKLLEDDGTGKYPFEVCASTDEGAMTIEAYCNSKNWTLA